MLCSPAAAIPKVVFSASLAQADWPESRIARGDLAEEIANLKRESEKYLHRLGWRLICPVSGTAGPGR
jgi:hypothetical protein